MGGKEGILVDASVGFYVWVWKLSRAERWRQWKVAYCYGYRQKLTSHHDDCFVLAFLKKFHLGSKIHLFLSNIPLIIIIEISSYKLPCIVRPEPMFLRPKNLMPYIYFNKTQIIGFLLYNFMHCALYNNKSIKYG